MKYVTIVLLTVVFLVGSFGCASADLMGTSRQVGSMERLRLSAQDHLNKAETLEQEIEQLAEKVITLDQKVAKYREKPYLDTKGIRRTGLKLLMGTTLHEIKTLEEQMAWHQKEASRLANLEQSSEGGGSRS
ncbi:MAG: hypothetical protein NPIRA02_39030 [Nitrospirales bacterium]|nr:MAG: hypothetical protein NPIRA02_39030 [Nitrospirales bacterium]